MFDPFNAVIETTPTTEMADTLYTANPINLESFRTSIDTFLVCHARNNPKTNIRPKDNKTLGSYIPICDSSYFNDLIFRSLFYWSNKIFISSVLMLNIYLLCYCKWNLIRRHEVSHEVYLKLIMGSIFYV